MKEHQKKHVKLDGDGVRVRERFLRQIGCRRGTAVASWRRAHRGGQRRSRGEQTRGVRGDGRAAPVRPSHGVGRPEHDAERCPAARCWRVRRPR